jgi:anthranilate phosphoribosyltransferase
MATTMATTMANSSTTNGASATETKVGVSQKPPVDLPSLVDVKPLLSRLWPCHPSVQADEIADALALFFKNQVSEAQSASLLMCLHFTGLDRRADVLAECAARMRAAAAQIDVKQLGEVISRRGRREGAYEGGLCDIVGTGGDSHNTFNISTSASIICSSLLLMAKHGNRASTSKSGSADLLDNMPPRAPAKERVTAATIAEVYASTNYAFLFAPKFHPGMRFVAPIRKQLPWRTIFNLLGPLSNPLDVERPLGLDGSQRSLLEARVVGVARKDLGGAFAEALRLGGARKAMVVCGDEELDEISCAGPTHCWRLVAPSRASGSANPETPGGGRDPGVQVASFTLRPSDFGLPCHPLATVSPGKEPAENAALLHRILHSELADDDPILHFVLMNAAALFVISGVCEADASDLGHGDDGQVVTERGPGGGRWKEGVRRARWALRSGEAWRQWTAFVDVTNGLPE